MGWPRGAGLASAAISFAAQANYEFGDLRKNEDPGSG